MIERILAQLDQLSEIPSDNAHNWLVQAEDSVEFLKSMHDSEHVVIYASAKCVLIHGLLVPTENITPLDGNDLQHSRIPDVDDSWCIQRAWGGGEGHRIYLEPPLSSHGKSCLNGEKLIFRRSLTGVQRGPWPIELSQKLVHSLDLYFIPERNAYSRLDRRGDIEDVISVYQRPRQTEWDWFDVVTILREDLDRYMAVSGMSLLIRFDFTRVRWGSFGGWGKIQRFERGENDVIYHGGSDGQGSFVNGAIILRPRVTVDDLVEQWKREEDHSNRQYAKFKIWDRKNQALVETSCGPEFLSNYFEKSELPWEISPVFFRPDVLLRFKADPEKYTLEERSISCRGAWHLKTYDINEVGQVHTYIGYLTDLPYEEQLYWQSFNEWPRGPISKRAFQTDIRGEWDLEYDPLMSLKAAIRSLDRSSPDWWTKRGDDISSATRYPVTDSPKEWGDEILALDQLLTEGFLVKPLRKIAEAGGRGVENKWGSIRVLQEALIADGLSEEEALDAVEPIKRLHGLRTDIRGHATVEKKRKAEAQARSTFGSLRAHFRQLVQECDSALRSIAPVLGSQITRS